MLDYCERCYFPIGFGCICSATKVCRDAPTKSERDCVCAWYDDCPVHDVPKAKDAPTVTVTVSQGATAGTCNCIGGACTIHPKPNWVVTEAVKDAPTPAVSELRKSLTCLYLNTPEEVARDVHEKANAAVAELQSRISTLEAKLQEQEEFWVQEHIEMEDGLKAAQAKLQAAREALVEAAIPLAAIQLSVDWELPPTIMEAIKKAVQRVHEELTKRDCEKTQAG